MMNERIANFDKTCPFTSRSAFICEEYGGLIVLIEHNSTISLWLCPRAEMAASMDDGFESGGVPKSG